MSPCKTPYEALTSVEPTLKHVNWSNDQRWALDEWHHIINDYVLGIDKRDIATYRCNGGLTALVALLGRMFFNGALQDVECRGRTTLHEQRPRVVGVTRRSKVIGKFIIELDIDMPLEQPEHNAFSQSVLSVLLHECVHCYFRTVACSGQCGPDSCEEEYYERLPMEGHGGCWQSLAELVEWKAIGLLGIPDLNLNIEEAAKKPRKFNVNHLRTYYPYNTE